MTGFTLITASKIQDASGRPLANGRVSFFPVSSPGGGPISATAGGGGIIGQSAVPFLVVGGVITSDLYGNPAQIADTTLTTPQNIAYKVTVTDANGNSVEGPGYGLVQPSGTSWSLDTYSPVQPLQVTVQAGPTGPTGAAATVTSTATNGAFTVASNLSAKELNGEMIASQFANMTFTATTSIGSTALTGVSSVAGLVTGMAASGTGIPAATTITVSGSVVTLSNPATAAGSITITVTGAGSNGLANALAVAGTGAKIDLDPQYTGTESIPELAPGGGNATTRSFQWPNGMGLSDRRSVGSFVPVEAQLTTNSQSGATHLHRYDANPSAIAQWFTWGREHNMFVAAPGSYSQGKESNAVNVGKSVVIASKCISQDEGIVFRKLGTGDASPRICYSYSNGGAIQGDDEGFELRNDEHVEGGAAGRTLPLSTIVSTATAADGTQLLRMAVANGNNQWGAGRYATLVKNGSGADASIGSFTITGYGTSNGSTSGGYAYLTIAETLTGSQISAAYGQTAPVTFTATTTSGSTALSSVSSLVGVFTGQPVTGTGIPAGTTLIVSGSSVSLSNAATASGSVSFTVSGFTVPYNNDLPQTITIPVTLSSAAFVTGVACMQGQFRNERVQIVTAPAAVGGVQLLTIKVENSPTGNTVIAGTAWFFQDSGGTASGLGQSIGRIAAFDNGVGFASQSCPILGATGPHTLVVAANNIGGIAVPNDIATVIPVSQTATFTRDGSGVAHVTPSGSILPFYKTSCVFTCPGNTSFNTTVVPTVAIPTLNYANAGAVVSTPVSGTIVAGTGRNVIKLYRGVEVIRVADPTQSGDALGTNIGLEYNNITWPTGGTVECPSHYSTHIVMDIMSLATSQPTSGSFGQIVNFFGTGITNAMTAQTFTNQQPSTFYANNGGFASIPNFCAIVGLWKNYWTITEPADGAYIMNIGYGDPSAPSSTVSPIITTTNTTSAIFTVDQLHDSLTVGMANGGRFTFTGSNTGGGLPLGSISVTATEFYFGATKVYVATAIYGTQVVPLGQVQGMTGAGVAPDGAVASASTIAMPGPVVIHIGGTSAIATATPPTGWGSGNVGLMSVIADAAWTTVTTGNIKTAITAVAGTLYTWAFDGTNWYIK